MAATGFGKERDRLPSPAPDSGGVSASLAGMIRVFLLDDHEVVRRGLADLLETEGDITVAGEAATAAEALRRVPAVRPDVAILDVRLPDGDGVSVARELREAVPGLKCLMLTSFADDEALAGAALAGAGGYLLKEIRGGDLVEAVRRVAAGESLISAEAAKRALERLSAAADRELLPGAGLSAQEERILELLADGLTNRQIAERMFLAEKTVRNYVSRLLRKLGLTRRTQAAILADQLRRERERPDT